MKTDSTLAHKSHCDALKSHPELLKGIWEQTQHIVENTEARELHGLLADGQRPNRFAVCCIDSRVTTPAVLGLPPGRVLDHHNMGNIVTPHDATDVNPDDSICASLSFALSAFNIDTIIVMGHIGCGLVKAVMERARQQAAGAKHPEQGISKPIVKWMNHASEVPARVARHYKGLTPEEADRAAVAENVVLQLERARRNPDVKKALKDKPSLAILGLVYELGNHGMISAYNESTGQFQPAFGAKSLLPTRLVDKR